jgi:hypothetical protein
VEVLGLVRNVTLHPTSAWVIQQSRESFPSDAAPKCLIFDGDSTFSATEARAGPRGGFRENPGEKVLAHGHEAVRIGMLVDGRVLEHLVHLVPDDVGERVVGGMECARLVAPMRRPPANAAA